MVAGHPGSERPTLFTKDVDAAVFLKALVDESFDRHRIGDVHLHHITDTPLCLNSILRTFRRWQRAVAPKDGRALASKESSNRCSNAPTFVAGLAEPGDEGNFSVQVQHGW